MKASYANLFVELGKYTLTTVLVVTGCIASAAIASSHGKSTSNNGPMIAKSAELAIKAPSLNVCPAKAKIAGWIYTSKPGQVSYVIERKDDDGIGPFTIDAVKSVNGGMASFSTIFKIQEPINTQYRVITKGVEGEVASEWVPLKANCSLQLASSN